MATSLNAQWDKLFGIAPDGTSAVRFEWLVLRKRGHAFLFLPSTVRFAYRALMVYPAQTPFARAARACLRGAFRLHLPVPVQRECWAACAENEFVKFLAALVGIAPGALPTPAVLAGNPAGPGPRYMLLISDPKGVPKVVVKAGTSQAAKELIRAEVNILSQLPAGLTGTPRVLATFKSEHLEAFALEFFAGDSPRTNNPRLLGELLGSWIDLNRTVRIADIPSWKRLVQACGGLSTFKPLANALADHEVHPAVWHGDFVPWNIKVNPKDGRWTVLDWERAELIGMPAWDWFHYVTQTEILVNKCTAKKLLGRVESLLAADPFCTYAARAQITNIARLLLLAYLQYNNTVIQPAEGLTTAKELLDLLSFTS